MDRPARPHPTRRQVVFTVSLALLACVAVSWTGLLDGRAQGQASPAAPGARSAAKSLFALLSEDGQFRTFISVVRAAGWTEKLEMEGPFTLFAPTDEAFTKLPAGTLETLLRPENKERLVQLLSYHLVPGRLTATDLARSDEVKTLLGDELDIEVGVNGKATQVDEANLTVPDLDAANGILHVLDRVLQP